MQVSTKPVAGLEYRDRQSGTAIRCPSSDCTARMSRSPRASSSSMRGMRRRRASGRSCPRTISRRGASDRASRERMVVAGRGDGGDRVAVRRGQRARPALSPGDRRPGGGHAMRDVPRTAVGRARHQRGVQRAHHRRPWPDKDTRNARLRECVDIMRALRRRDRVARRLFGSTGEAAHAPGLTAASDRTGHQRGHRPMGGSGPTGWPRSTSRGPSWRR